jgi:type IV pilus assembly protein PilB
MAVLRILDKTFAFRPLSEIGFLPEILDTYLMMVQTPFGMILSSGPTGSGKTTTLYATVNQLDSTGRNIILLKNRVEDLFSIIQSVASVNHLEE